MANCTRITLTKQFTYRDQPEQFSNTYTWSNIGPPATDTTAWDQLRDQLLAAEKTIFPTSIKFIDIYGWNDANPQIAHVYYYAWPVGTEPTGSFVVDPNAIPAAGDQAACVAWPAVLKSSRGKPVYFRKYFHRPWIQFNDADKLEATYLAALNAFAGTAHNVWQLNGPLANQFGAKSYAPLANRASGPGSALPFVTTRTLKRRGKRPLPRA